MLSIENLFLLIAIVALQFLDWWTTKVFVAQDGIVAEGNPFARKTFEESGVSVKFLLIKIYAGTSVWIFTSILLKTDFAKDIIIGAMVIFMLIIVLNNFSGILTLKFLKYSKIPVVKMENFDPNLMQKVKTRNAFCALDEVVLFFIIGWWVYQISESGVILGTAFMSLVYFLTSEVKNLRDVANYGKKLNEK